MKVGTRKGKKNGERGGLLKNWGWGGVGRRDVGEKEKPLGGGMISEGGEKVNAGEKLGEGRKRGSQKMGLRNRAERRGYKKENRRFSDALVGRNSYSLGWGSPKKEREKEIQEEGLQQILLLHGWHEGTTALGSSGLDGRGRNTSPKLKQRPHQIPVHSQPQHLR